MRNACALLLLALLALTTPACSDTNPDPTRASGPDIPESEEFNGADVEFATEMIQHHAQALTMVDLTRGRDVSPALGRLAEAILMTQGPEIETMTDWLTDWGQPVPETVRDHANAHGDGTGGTHADAPGMMSEEDLAALEGASGEEFERRWLELMIEHHRGAIEMAQEEQSAGEYPAAVELAGAIEAAQQAEVETMEELLLADAP